MVNFRPLHDLCLIRPTDDPLRAGLLHLPPGAHVKEAPRAGVIVSVGRGGLRRHDPLVKPGDRVLVGKNPVEKIINGEKFLLVPESEILAVCE
jgi:co-chaperonin GroES (HSP10)